MQGFDVGRITADGAGRRIPYGFFQYPGQAGGLGDETTQAFIKIITAAFEVFGCCDHTDRAAAIAERNGPEPDVTLGGMGGDEDLGTVEVRVVDMVFDMGEHRLAYREIRRCFKVEQAREDAAVTTGVEHEVSFDAVLAAVFAANAEQRVGLLDIDADDGFAIADFHALQRGLISQQFVEIGALHLESRWLALRECVAEIEGAVALAPGKRGPGFQLETRRIDGVEHARFFDEIQAVG
ncbi:hypothetical protein D3C76_1148540 [compost metagenome]